MDALFPILLPDTFSLLLMIFPRLVFSTKSFPFSSSLSPPPTRNSSETLSPQTLLKIGVSLSTKSLNLLFSFLLENRKFIVLLETVSQLSDSIQIDSQTHFLIVRALLRSRRFEEAKQFISTAKKIDFSFKKSLWDSLIRKMCVVGDDPERALSLLHECIRTVGILPSLATFHSLIFSFSSQGRIERAIEVLETMTSEKVGYSFDNFVCSSIVSGFSRIGKPDLGLGFYEKVKNIKNYQPNLITYTAVIDALGREGRIYEASAIVQQMEKDGIVLDAVLYTSWISGYIRKGLLMEGFRKHKLMSQNRIIPDVISYTSLIDGLCKEGYLEKVIGLIKYLEKSGLKPNLVTYTSIIQGFCKRCKMEEAFFIFRNLEKLNIVADEFVYSVLIYGLCTIGKLDQVFELLEEMDRKGIKATSVTYNTVVNGLCKSGKTSKADEMSRNYFGDNYTYSTLLHGYMMEKDARGVIDTRRRLEEAGIPFDVVTANILIKALFIVGMFDEACSLFEVMPEKGLIADSLTYCTMVSGICKSGMVDRALNVFMEYRSTPAFVDDACHICMIGELCKEGKVELATDLFLELCENNIVSDTITYRKLMKAHFVYSNWEAVLKLILRIERHDPEILSSIYNDSVNFLCQRECFPGALEAYILMRLKGLTIWSKSYYVLLKSFIKTENVLILELVLCDYIKACGLAEPKMVNISCLYLCKKNALEVVRLLPSLRKGSISLSVLTAIINTLKKNGRIQEALDFLLEAEENGVAADIFVYSIIVDGLCKAGSFEKALELCSHMRKKGFIPNIATYNLMIHGLCREGCLVEAFRLFDSLEYNGICPTTATYATLIGALCGEGFLQDAKQLLDRMALKGLSPNIRTLNCLIYGYCRFGFLEEGLQVVQDLALHLLEPDGFTISSLICGYCTKGDMHGALDFYNVYREKGYLPDFLGFLNLVKGLFTKGRMEEARNIIRDMLQHREAVELINKAEDGLNSESLLTSIELACNEGRLQEAINILTDASFKFFPPWWFKNSNSIKDVGKEHTIGTFSTGTERKVNVVGSLMMAAVPGNASHFVEDRITERIQGLCKNKLNNSVLDEDKGLCQNSLKYDFESFYSIIASLCSKGELQRANDIVKATVLS